MDYFPLYANLKQRPVLVVGAGEVAFRKIELLRQAGAQVRVIAAKVGAAVQQLLEQNQVQWLKAHFEPSDVEQAVLTIAATDDAQLNQAVHDACVQRHRLVNVVDNPALCTFIVPAIVDRSPVQIAISTGGTAPVLARQLRQKIEQALPPVLAPMATLAGQYRSRVKAVLTQATVRRSFWEKLFADPIFTEALSAQRAQHAEQRLQQLLHTQVDTTLIGQVTLVGAGPGDSGLLTLAGFQALQAADVVLYDALVGKDVLAF
ncbi:MAG: siroheme synthase, partial [Alcaligenaceae bacterium]|nr:siroheme synthase [Alcaligenaceae bacterium]